jgi:hypothetical protein
MMDHMAKSLQLVRKFQDLPAQNLPKFQMPCLTPKSVQTCSIQSHDGDRKVLSEKIDPFMTNGCHNIVAPPDVTSD